MLAAGPTEAELQAISARVGFDLSQFTSRRPPRNALVSSILPLLTLVVLIYPIWVLVQDWVLERDRSDVFMLAIMGVVLLALNLVGGVLAQFDIYKIRANWEKALASVKAQTGEEASKALYETIEEMRHLLAWRYFVIYTTIPFHGFYAAFMVYALLEALGLLSTGYTDPGLHTLIAWFALAYYAIAFIVRMWIINIIFEHTDVDPSLKLFIAFADLHKRLLDCIRRGG